MNKRTRKALNWLIDNPKALHEPLWVMVSLSHAGLWYHHWRSWAYGLNARGLEALWALKKERGLA